MKVVTDLEVSHEFEFSKVINIFQFYLYILNTTIPLQTLHNGSHFAIKKLQFFSSVLILSSDFEEQ